jgi:hypothetical protein
VNGETPCAREQKEKINKRDQVNRDLVEEKKRKEERMIECEKERDGCMQSMHSMNESNTKTRTKYEREQHDEIGNRINNARSCTCTRR